MTYPPVPLDATAADLAGQSLAVVGAGPDGRQTVVLVAFGKPGHGRIDTRIADTAIRTPMPTAVRARVPGTAMLRELVLAHAGVAAERAGGEVDVQWPDGRSPFGPTSTTLGMGLMLFAVWLTPGASPAQFSAFLTLLVVGAVVLTATIIAWKRPSRLTELPLVGGGPVVRNDRQVLLPSEIARRVPSEIGPPGRDGVGLTPADRVNVVKAEYGRLLTDICYRIENSALFDAAVTETARFHVALLSWDSTGADGPDAASVATEVEASFVAARAHAEGLGWAHLPTTAREPARRARLAAITALGNGPEGERAAARSRVAEILGSLALYYLPPVDPDTPQLIGQRRAIEPAP